MCVYVLKEIHYKELAHMIKEAGKSKICRVGWQAWRPSSAGLAWRPSTVQPGRPMLQVESEGRLLENSFLLEGGWSFRSIQALEWLDEAHPH